jgi:hypothetical protein
VRTYMSINHIVIPPCDINSALMKGHVGTKKTCIGLDTFDSPDVPQWYQTDLFTLASTMTMCIHVGDGKICHINTGQ